MEVGYEEKYFNLNVCGICRHSLTCVCIVVRRRVCPGSWKSLFRCSTGFRGESGHRLLLQLSVWLWKLDQHGALRVCLVPPENRLWLAPIQRRILGLDRLWVDMGLGRRLGLDSIPLRTVGLGRRHRLVLGPWNYLGSGLGQLEVQRSVLRLGAPPAWCRVPGGNRYPVTSGRYSRPVLGFCPGFAFS